MLAQSIVAVSAALMSASLRAASISHPCCAHLAGAGAAGCVRAPRVLSIFVLEGVALFGYGVRLWVVDATNKFNVGCLNFNGLTAALRRD